MKPFEHVFYAGPYVPSGVTYGIGSPSEVHWLVPGFDSNPGIHKIDIYETDAEYKLRRSRDEWRKDFNTLCEALVGKTGLSAIEEARKLRAMHPLGEQE